MKRKPERERKGETVQKSKNEEEVKSRETKRRKGKNVVSEQN